MYADGKIQWTTGDDSGGYNGVYGIEALVGINAGNGFDHYVVSGSRTSSIINIARSSNVGILGTYIFKVGGMYVRRAIYVVDTEILLCTYVESCYIICFLYT